MVGSPEPNRDAHFVGPIPDLYERFLVPMLFQPPAESLARVVAGREPAQILETAAGTGALTRALLEVCPGATITATDLNRPMLDTAMEHTPETAAVRWQQADALDLPFDNQTFDLVVCQFGVMFFPDRVGGYREAVRVLRPGGSFIFNTWDQLEHNEVPFVIQSALVEAAPSNPLVFMSRTPHGYSSPTQIRADLAEADMSGAFTVVDGTSWTTAADAALAFCQGTPLRVAIENHETLSVSAATTIAEEALLRRFGPEPFGAAIRWLEVVAQPTG
jgi:SAM-dependent methyltransferase